VDAHAAFTAESSTEQKAAYEKWEHSNSTSLMIMKGYITTAIRGAIPDSDNAKLYFAHIEEQFQGSSNAHATTLITRMVTLKYSGSNGFREHILWMNDMTSQLKSLDMEISKGFLVHFIMTFLPAQFGPFKINYNTQKEKEREVEDERVDFHVGAPLPHIEDNDAPEVVPNDEPPIIDSTPISANEQPLQRSERERWTAISDDYTVYLDEADYNLGIGNDPSSFIEAIMSDPST
ncbi:hypothetical protein RJ640_010634, partial [Escallonia rubra]